MPFWVHHNLTRFDNVNTAVNKNNKSLVRLDVINEYDMSDEKYQKIREFRNKIGQNYDDNKTAKTEFMLENQILTAGVLSSGISFSTKDIAYTKEGLYYLSDLTSSLKSVWSLDSNLKVNADSPKLNLNYINREIFPYLIDNTNQILKTRNVYKLDSFGQPIEIVNSNIPVIEKNTQKNVVETKVNVPQYKVDMKGKKIKVELPSNSIGRYLHFFNVNNNTNFDYYFEGPYLNDISKISYKINDKSTNTEIVQNDVAGRDELRFYVKINETSDSSKSITIDLFELLNSNKTKPLSSYSSTDNLTGYFIKYYLGNDCSKIDFKNGRFYLDQFSENSNIYNKLNFDEKCNFYGFKFKNNTLSSIPDSKKELFLDEKGNDITSVVLKDNIYDITMSSNVVDKLSSFYLSSPETLLIPVSFENNKKFMLVKDEYMDGNFLKSNFFNNKLENHFNVEYPPTYVDLSGYLSSSLTSMLFPSGAVIDTIGLKNDIDQYTGYIDIESKELQEYINYDLNKVDIFIQELSGKYSKEYRNITVSQPTWTVSTTSSKISEIVWETRYNPETSSNIRVSSEIWHTIYEHKHECRLEIQIDLITDCKHDFKISSDAPVIDSANNNVYYNNVFKMTLFGSNGKSNWSGLFDKNGSFSNRTAKLTTHKLDDVLR